MTGIKFMFEDSNIQRECEAEANYFARCVLMPENLVREYMDGHEVCLMDTSKNNFTNEK